MASTDTNTKQTDARVASYKFSINIPLYEEDRAQLRRIARANGQPYHRAILILLEHQPVPVTAKVVRPLAGSDISRTTTRRYARPEKRVSMRLLAEPMQLVRRMAENAEEPLADTIHALLQTMTLKVRAEDLEPAEEDPTSVWARAHAEVMDDPEQRALFRAQVDAEVMGRIP